MNGKARERWAGRCQFKRASCRRAPVQTRLQGAPQRIPCSVAPFAKGLPLAARRALPQICRRALNGKVSVRQDSRVQCAFPALFDMTSSS